MLESQENIHLLKNKYLLLIEEYHRKTDNAGFERVILDKSNEFADRKELGLIDCCEILINIGSDKYKKYLPVLGLEGTKEQILRYFKQIKSKYDIDAENKKITKAKEDNDFYTLVGIASESMGFNIPSNILLAEWVGILNALQRKNEAIKKINNGRGN